MTETEARAWLTTELAVPRETMAALAAYIALLRSGNARQNLVAASTIEEVWGRHIVDSAQLHPFLRAGTVIDIGSGAGLPGIVLALVGAGPLTLVEPRRKRADFLSSCVEALGLACEVRQTRIERISGAPAATIVARAFAPLTDIFAAAGHLADRDTRWIVPKGRTAQDELAAARDSWHGDFRTVPSITDSAAKIVVAENVRRKHGEGTGR